jgi:putative membrane protein
MKSKVIAALVLAAPLATIGAASAQQMSAEEFVQKVAISDMFEVQSGRLAANQAEDEDVKSFGGKMSDDHKQTTDDLLELVQEQNINVELPKALDQDHQAKLDKLKESSGNEFDRSYVPMQVQAHETAVDLFDKYAKNGDNEKLKDWAEDTLPTLQDHLKEAKALNEEMKAEPATAEPGDQNAREGKEDQESAARDETREGAKVSEQTAGSDIKFVTRQEPKDWSAEALIGRTVENAQGENLGEINNVILNEKGSVVAVVIGVGGFLGIGEKDVGVPFDALEYRAQEQRSDRTDTGTGEQTQDRAASRFDTEHANIDIVLNATQEQLEKAPQFVWLDEQDTEGERDERSTR